MNSFTQGLVGMGICAITFAAGIVVGGKQSGASPAATSQELRLVIPENITLTHRGLISDRERCLEWVSANFKEPNVGQLAMICAGAKL